MQFQNGVWSPLEQQPAREFLIKLTVNKHELVTLTASPHQLNFLIIGFLRLQGFIATLDDILTLGVCEDDGVAEVRLKKNIPASLQPVLTSGCGSGITFNTARGRQLLSNASRSSDKTFEPDLIFKLMKSLYTQASCYRMHGGIHSSAVGDENGLHIVAEDIGRHNTLDRIAGQALFNNMALDGKILLTSGRVSSEMVSKAAQLGIDIIGTRTSPTDLAVQMCRELRITLLGYIRNSSMNLYSEPERIAVNSL